MRPRLEEAGAQVRVEGAFPLLQGSISQFERLFRNLLANAVKFRAEEPLRIEIRATQSGDEWVVEVCDNGIGIDPTKTDRIFDVFQRLHSQERYAGTGMGLAICKRIVERHGGRIWVDPIEAGGSAFRFTLPA